MMEYKDFIKTASRTLLLGSEKELPSVPSSPARMESASTASVTSQPPDASPPKEPPQKILHFG
jgi:hypothetical protein